MQIINKIKIVKNKIIRNLFDPIIIFTNHQVSDTFDNEIDCITDWSSIELFKANVEWIRNHFHIISLAEALEILENGKRIKEKYAVFTFDDGYASTKNALQILNDKQIPATLFICTAYLNDSAFSSVNVVNFLQGKNKLDTEQFPEELLEAVMKIDRCRNKQEYKYYYSTIRYFSLLIKPKKRVYLTDNELNSLNPGLFTIALHGHEHYNSMLIEDEVIESNIKMNDRLLRQFRNFKPYFAFPYGNADPGKINIVRNMGYIPFLCDGQKCYKKADAYSRIAIDGRDLSGYQYIQ